ncbi:hypothetical protein D3C86_2264340 [compost metagenome]
MAHQDVGFYAAGFEGFGNEGAVVLHGQLLRGPGRSAEPGQIHGIRGRGGGQQMV